MLTVAIYLMVEARQLIGRGYWDVAMLAVKAPFMRLFPDVWVPALCWVLLVSLGCWFLYKGAQGSQGYRDSMAMLWAANEMVICAGLLVWGLYVPDTWQQAAYINFALEGIYVGFFAGALMRLMLLLLSPNGASKDGKSEQESDPGGSHWLGRIRRY